MQLYRSGHTSPGKHFHMITIKIKVSYKSIVIDPNEEAIKVELYSDSQGKAFMGL